MAHSTDEFDRLIRAAETRIVSYERLLHDTRLHLYSLKSQRAHLVDRLNREAANAVGNALSPPDHQR